MVGGMESFVQRSSKGERKGADLKAEKRRLCLAGGGVEPAGLLLLMGDHCCAVPPPVGSETQPGR